MKFYTWRQNNSGGSFEPPAAFVSIQATSLRDARKRAKALGLYFDGEGDCPTCGDRWHEDPAEIADAPLIYDKPVAKVASESLGRTWLITYLDGRTEHGS